MPGVSATLGAFQVAVQAVQAAATPLTFTERVVMAFALPPSAVVAVVVWGYPFRAAGEVDTEIFKGTCVAMNAVRAFWNVLMLSIRVCETTPLSVLSTSVLKF